MCRWSVVTQIKAGMSVFSGPHHSFDQVLVSIDGMIFIWVPLWGQKVIFSPTAESFGQLYEVLRGLWGVASTNKSTACCWGYHLGLFLGAASISKCHGLLRLVPF